MRVVSGVSDPMKRKHIHKTDNLSTRITTLFNNCSLPPLHRIEGTLPVNPTYVTACLKYSLFFNIPQYYYIACAKTRDQTTGIGLNVEYFCIERMGRSVG